MVLRDSLTFTTERSDNGHLTVIVCGWDMNGAQVVFHGHAGDMHESFAAQAAWLMRVKTLGDMLDEAVAAGAEEEMAWKIIARLLPPDLVVDTTLRAQPSAQVRDETLQVVDDLVGETGDGDGQAPRAG